MTLHRALFIVLLVNLSLHLKITSAEEVKRPKTFSDKFTWRDLTIDELKSWYSPADLCVMNSVLRNRFPQDIRQYDCANYTKGSRKLFCGVGFGNNNRPCYGPYGQARPSFLRGIDGYTDSTQKPMMEALEQMIRTNTTLVLLGDSTMRQKKQALNCQLIRENPSLWIRGNIFGVTPCDTILTVTFPDGRSTQVHALSLGPQAYGCIKDKGSVAKTSPESLYKHADGIIQSILNTSNVAIIANMGMWFNDVEYYKSMVPPVLDWLLGIAKTPGRNNIVAWHESVMQHWRNEDGSGYYSKAETILQQESIPTTNFSTYSDENFMVPGCCSRVTNSSYMADWRNDIVAAQFKANSELRNTLHLLPMASLTRDLPDLHTCNPYLYIDCTHYCYMPMMWQPLWHQIKELTATA